MSIMWKQYILRDIKQKEKNTKFVITQKELETTIYTYFKQANKTTNHEI